MDSNYQYQSQNIESQAEQRAKVATERARAEKQRAKNKCLEHFGAIMDDFNAATRNGIEFQVKSVDKIFIKNYYYTHWENYILYLFIPFLAYSFSFFTQSSSLFIFTILVYSFFVKSSFFVGKYLRDLDCEKEELKIIENQIFPRKQGELKELFVISTILFIASNITFYYSKVVFLSDNFINKIAPNLQNFNPENELFALVNFVSIAILFSYKLFKRN